MTGPGQHDSRLAKSRDAFARAQRVIPGGVNSPARAFGAVGGEPPFIQRGEGPFLYDLDGNRYLDYIGSWGPLILGHAHPDVVEAVQQAAERGTSFGAPTELETKLAEMIVQAVPSVESVRMVNSGTEATMSALRLARAYTGRDVVVKFAGCYHGHVDALLVQAGSSATTLGVPSSPGVTQGTTRDTLALPYNDADAAADAFQQRGAEIAAVIVEPVAGNMGTVLPKPGFLETLRELTTRHGALLIFDEVITGFRLGYGGAQERLGVTPDLTTLGKVVGGGMPVGAYGGRAEIMDWMMPAGKVFQAGTLSGNPLAMACGIATLRRLRDDPPYQRLGQLAARLADGLRAAAAEAGVAHRVAQIGSMLTLFFSDQPVVDHASALHCETQRFAHFFWGMMDRGFYLPCSQFEAMFASAAHTETQIDQTIAAAQEVLGAMSDE